MPHPPHSLGAVEGALREGGLDAVLLYSPRSARIWRGLVEAAGLADAGVEAQPPLPVAQCRSGPSRGLETGGFGKPR